MKIRTRLVVLFLALIMVMSCAPISVFATDTATLQYESELYDENNAVSSYKQYEAFWNDPTYVKADVKYTVYFDTENATATRDVVFYVINWNGERIGTDTDTAIVTDLIKAPASEESGNRWAVVVVDFGGNPLAKAPNIELSLAFLRAELSGKKSITVWQDDSHTTTTTVPVHKNHVYVLPAGYRVARDIPYYETDYHASLGTRNYVMDGWNSHIAGNRTIYYAYHTGDQNCSFDHTTNTGVECIAGAPQEIGDEVVAYTAGQLAPTVSRPADCRKKDGSPLDYVCRLDIIYPSGEDVEATPVMVQAATASPRMSNVGTYTLSDYDGDGEDSLCLRTMLVGMEFSGYTVAVYDYAYSPLARDDHYGYIDPYGTHDQNGAKTGRAAIRCIRYFAEKYGYDDSKIGVAGISKGTPTTAVLSTVNNKNVEENSYFTYDIDGSGNKVNTQNTWFEGDINDEGVVTQAQTSVVQPYLTYEAGYNGNKINGVDINYDATKTGEISSEVSVVYCAAGDGINWVYNGNSTIKLGATNTNTGEKTQHVPMVLSAGYYDPHGAWNRWSKITDHFTNYADNPFLAISMEDMGHDYPAEHDPIRDYDRYDAYMQFFHSILNPEYYTPQVAWITPVDGAIDVSVESPIQVQLVKPATTLNAFESAVTVKDNYGNLVAGTWSTNNTNTSGLYTFFPENGYTSGAEYTVTVDSPVVSEKTSKSFTVEAAGVLRPVADTYVSSANKNAVYGTEKTLYIDNQRTYLATFKTSDFEGANKAYLNLPITGKNSQTLSVYLLDGFEVDESATCYNNTPAFEEDKLLSTYKVSEGDSKLDLLGIVAKVKEEYFTLAISGSAHYYEENFESYNGTKIVAHSSSNTSSNAPGADDCYSEHYVWRTAGGTGDMKVGTESNNKVGYVVSNATWNRIKWYNSFVSDKAYLDSSDIGKTFDLSFQLKVVLAPENGTSTRLRYALDTSVGTKTTYSATPTANTWTPVTHSFAITEDVVKSNGTDTKIGILSFTLDGTAGNTYYFDDIIVREQAPTELVSRENTSAVAAYITTETIDETGIIADTYVSKGNPDSSFGNDDKLLLNGGSKENIIFVTYSAKSVKDGSDIQFTIPANDNVSVSTEMYLLDGYYVDEDQLTYNNMPDLASAVSLGKHTLSGGINTIEIENAAEQINGDYFTIVFKATDNYEVVYFNNFENYKVGTDINVYTNNVADTATDASGKTYTYYYAHVADGVDVTTNLARSGGSLSSIGNVLTDPNGSGNQTVDIYMSTDTAATYYGRIKLYNSISDGILTADSPLVGQTLRFTAKIKAGNQTTIDNKCSAFASAMLSVGGNPLTDANENNVKSNVISVSDQWQTVTVDYTVRAEDIKVSTTTGGNPVWAYPSFTIDFSNKNASNVFLIDDLGVVTVNSDGTLRNVEIVSSEGADSLSDTISIKARKVQDPVADTYISATNKTGVFGLEKTLYADSQRTYLVTFKTADFDKSSKTYLSLPLSGDKSQTLSVYLLDGFKVNERETNYNNTPALTADMLIGTYEVSEESCKIDLSNALAKVEDDYFTVAVKGSAHYYEENFEGYTDSTIAPYNHNNASENAPGADDCYSEYYVWRTGGGTGNMSVGEESNNKVGYVASNATWNRIKWYNSFVSDKAYLDSSDIGKTFDLSFQLKVVLAPENGTSTRLRYALDTSVGTKTTYSATPTANTWTPVTHSFDITEDVVKSNGADTKIGILSFTLDGTAGNTYYFDDIIVSEVAPKAIASLESDGQTATIITANDIIADTYVSEANPDTCYGNDDTLKFGDKNGDKKALVLSFMNDVIGEKNYVDLKLENSADSIKNVYVYYVLNYCANESILTWNTMPEYETNLLGVYDINAGTNKIDISAIRDKLTGEYFTLVFRTENHTFYEDFDVYDVDTNIVANKNDNDTKETVDGTEYTHHHAFSEKVYYPENKYIISRQGGNIDTPTIIADTVTNIEGNQILKVTTGAAYQYGGRIKFYNSLNDSAITKDSDIVGKTFRFTAKVTIDPQACESTTSNIRVSANAVSSKSNTQLGDNKTTLRYDDLKNGWVTISVDYTVDKDDIAVLSGSYYYYPMFELFFAEGGSTTEFNTYFVDDISVVEVVDSIAVGDAEFASREAGEDISFVSALNDNVTVMEANVSSATTGAVFSIVDGGETYTLLSVSNGKLVFGEYTLCDGKGVPYELDETEIKVTAIYDDKAGTVRFAIGNKLAFYEANKVTYNHLVIEGGVGNDASFGVNGITASRLNSTNTELIGYQENLIDGTSIRFLTGLDSLYFSAVGFDLERDGVALQKGSSSPYVFSSVTIGSRQEKATDYGYNYLVPLVINNIDSSGVIKITPYVMVGEHKISGETFFYEITFQGGALKLEKVDENAVGEANNADIASITVDGDPVVGLSADKFTYSVPASDVTAMNIVAVPAVADASVSVSQKDNVATVTVTSFSGKVQKVYTLTAYEKLESTVVNKNGANAIVTYVFDDGNKDSATIVTNNLSPKYPSLNGSFALITQNLAMLSTIEGKEGDGLLEYEFDENGDYVYTKNDTNWEFWETLLNTYGDQGFEAINHTHTHAYIGENDNGGSFTYKSTSGDSFTSDVFPIGNVRKEYYASNQILRELGQRALTLVSAGLTAPDGGMVDYTESYVNLPKASGAFIGKRITATYPKYPEKMVNSIADLAIEDNRFNIKAYMVQHYGADPSAPSGTSADNYSREACLAAGVGYWTDYIDKAVESGEWAVFCFHNIKADTHTGTTGHFVYESQADAIFKYSDDLSKENKVWVANFTDACLYAFERSTAEVGAFIDDDGNIVVSLDDKEDDEIFTMPLTVKVGLPEGISTASLNGTELVTFEENSKFYTYVDIVPGSTVIINVLPEVYADISNVPYKALGRTQMLNSALTADWSGAGIEFEANCLGKVSVTLTSSASSLFTVVVDGIEYKDVMLSNGKNTIASGLSYGKHTFKIMNQTGYHGSVNITGVTIRGEFGEKPTDSSLLIEFIGDSITHGCGLGSSDYSEGTNDGTLTYAFLAAKELDADYTIMANGGMGVKWGGDYSGANLNRSMAKYPYLNDTIRGTIPYEGYTKDADLVVIGLSTNDNYRFMLQYNAEKAAYTAANPTADADAIATHMAEFKATKLAELGAELELLIAEIEKNHGKNVPIILARGMMEKDDELYLTSVTYMTDLIENEWGGMYGDHVIKVAHLTPNRKGYEQHPTREGAAIQGAELAKFIKDNFPDLVPKQ